MEVEAEAAGEERAWQKAPHTSMEGAQTEDRGGVGSQLTRQGKEVVEVEAGASQGEGGLRRRVRGRAAVGHRR